MFFLASFKLYLCVGLPDRGLLIGDPATPFALKISVTFLNYGELSFCDLNDLDLELVDLAILFRDASLLDCDDFN